MRAPDRLESAVLLTVEGDRHGAVSGGIACVDEHVAHYLVNVIPPPESTVCAADQDVRPATGPPAVRALNP